jgi:small conductance mechanosensitive channel
MDLREWIDVRAIGTSLVAFLPRLLAAVLILFAFWLAYRATRPPLRELLRRGRLDHALITLLVDNIYRLSLLVVAIVIAAGQVGINILPALAGIGVAGIALGFAAQDSVANVISGFLIFWDKPFVVGDWVTVQDQYGCVDEITLRTTRVRTPINSYVVIPNRKIIESSLTNHSKNGALRVDVPVAIDAGADLARARSALLAAARTLADVAAQPEPDVVIAALKPGAVELLVRVFIDDAAIEHPVRHRVAEACREALAEAEIEGPSPHVTLLLDAAGAQPPIPLRPSGRSGDDQG